MMIGNKETGGTRLYCRWCAVGWCVKNMPAGSVVVGRQQSLGGGTVLGLQQLLTQLVYRLSGSPAASLKYIVLLLD